MSADKHNRKVITKKEALKLKMGDVVRVFWNDSIDSTVMVLRPETGARYQRGSFYLEVVNIHGEYQKVESDQVLFRYGKVDLLQLMLDTERRFAGIIS